MSHPLESMLQSWAVIRVALRLSFAYLCAGLGSKVARAFHDGGMRESEGRCARARLDVDVDGEADVGGREALDKAVGAEERRGVVRYAAKRECGAVGLLGGGDRHVGVGDAVRHGELRRRLRIFAIQRKSCLWRSGRALKKTRSF